MGAGPDFDFLIVATRDHDSAPLLKLYIRDELVVRQDRVDDTLLPQVPDFDSVVVASSRDLIAI